MAQAILLVGATGSTDDTALQTILETAGHTVTRITDTTTEPDPSAYTVVLLSESCDDTQIGTKYRDTTTPVVNCLHQTWVPHNYTSAMLPTSARTDLEVVPGHPVAAGYSGVTTLLTTSEQFSRSDGGLPTDAVAILTIAGNLTRQIAWVYEAGATMASAFPAPGRRVAFGYRDEAYDSLTIAGTDILLAAVQWAGEGATVEDSIGGIDVTPSTASLLVDGTQQLTATATGVTGSPDESVTWSTSNASIATVDAAGLVTAVALGTCSITATSTFDGTKSGTSTINVVEEGDLPVSLDVLFVVADPAALGSADQTLRDHLRTGFGATVTLHDDGSAAPTLTDYDLIVISESCNSGTLGTKYQNAPVPLLSMENGGWDEQLFSTGSGTNAAATQIDVIDGTHPASGDLATGTHTILRSGTDLKYGTGLAAGATVVASVVGTPTQATFFVFEAGAALTTGTAAARYAGLGVSTNGGGYDALNESGWDLFDGVIDWLVGRDATKTRTALFVYGDGEATQTQGNPNQSELMTRTRLRQHGFTVTMAWDATITTGDGDAYDLVVVSKTVTSTTVGTKFKATPTPVMWWEDNLQGLNFMATIENDGSGGTTWHATGTQVHVDATVGDQAAGFSGVVDFYTQAGELTWAPAGELAAAATRVARFGPTGTNDRWSIYTLDAGDALAPTDGGVAAGRRGFFGIYDDFGTPTYRHLTNDGVALFDAQLAYLAGDEGEAVLTVDPATATPVAPSVAASQNHVLTVATATASPAAPAVSLTADVALTVEPATASPEAPSVALVQDHALAVEPATAGGEAPAVTVGQGHALAVTPATAEPAAPPVATVQDHVLTVAVASGSPSAPSVTMTSGIVLTVQVATAHAEAPSVTTSQEHVLTVEPATATATAPPVTTAQVHTLTLATATATPEAPSVILGSDTLLITAPATVAPEAPAVAMTQVHLLTVAPATGPPEAPSVTLEQGTVLQAATATAHPEAVAVAVTQVHLLTLEPATAHPTAVPVSLSQLGAVTRPTFEDASTPRTAVNASVRRTAVDASPPPTASDASTDRTAEDASTPRTAE